MFLKGTIVNVELLLCQVFAEIWKLGSYNNTLYFTRVSKIYKKQFSSRKLGVLTVAFGDPSVTLLELEMVQSSKKCMKYTFLL